MLPVLVLEATARGADDKAVANNAHATIVSATIREPVLLLMDETC